ncbi:MAG: hypothetical protein KJN64_06540, partial [Ignavibacteria bacterium]|nr:hypothetical protein [Ignavibacteria bacterium]
MKIIPAITFIISLVLLSNSFAQEQESNTLLEGTWVLAAFKYTLPDTVITGNSKSFNSIKIFGKSHF